MNRTVLLALLVTLPGVAQAQTVSLSQEQAVEQAVARHPLIKASTWNAVAAAARVKQVLNEVNHDRATFFAARTRWRGSTPNWPWHFWRGPGVKTSVPGCNWPRP